MNFNINLILKKILLKNQKNNINNIYLDNYDNNIYTNTKNYTPDMRIYKNNIFKLICPFSKKILYNKTKLKKPFYKKKIVQKIILKIHRTSLTLKRSRVFRYKIITCVGTNRQWVGIGEGKNRLFKRSYSKSVNTAKQNVYNLNFECNDYKQLKYKGCTFKALNMTENRKNLKMYDNLIKVSGYQKIKLVSYSSKTSINVLKSILHNF
ncbi:hypothetical protein TpMuguga_05g00013 (apicoplast) [Theileria parva strain Muguga]|uniref:Ribosomal protein S5, putative n=1 Tax=Theileria parva TaxID=5875 RepID=Q4MYB0_THEPA|nr:hypothetical protein TpMuguga_05g00013 [Theileria parva strain Muguga]|eukprot:XP_762682.1 ribosomal protein S5 (apicoplast) [Theileria parva strain Muguga]